MKLLITTQAIDKNDPVLGFFHGWVEEFAKQCEKVHVICLYEGEHLFPANVVVHSLGKEKGRGRVRYLVTFYTTIWKMRKDYDAVFVHMNQVYVLLGGLAWRLFHKRISLWYAHGAISFSLRLAERLADSITTSTPEGFRLKSTKVHIVGQGIDTELFSFRENEFDPDVIRIIYTGRISPVKRCELILEAMCVLKDKGIVSRAVLIGNSSDSEYRKNLERMADEYGITDSVTFIGGVSQKELIPYLRSANVFANTGMTGSLDKTGLEALACGVPVVTANPAYVHVFGKYSGRLMFKEDDAEDMAEHILALHSAPDRAKLITELSEAVHRTHTVKMLVSKILKTIGI